MQYVLHYLFEHRGDDNLNGVTVHSIEVWNCEGVLVAGELGTSVGAVYTSLTGFYTEDSTGGIQLLALGHLLLKNRFLLWDLGMFIEYKSSLGAGLLSRKDFRAKYKALRGKGDVRLECSERVNCRDLVNSVMASQGEKEAGDEKKQSENENGDAKEKPKSKNEMKRLAKLERRRLAKLRAKEEREKKLNQKGVGGDDDAKDVVMQNASEKQTEANTAT